MSVLDISLKDQLFYPTSIPRQSLNIAVLLHGTMVSILASRPCIVLDSHLSQFFCKKMSDVVETNQGLSV